MYWSVVAAVGGTQLVCASRSGWQLRAQAGKVESGVAGRMDCAITAAMTTDPASKVKSILSA